MYQGAIATRDLVDELPTLAAKNPYLTIFQRHVPTLHFAIVTRSAVFATA